MSSISRLPSVRKPVGGSNTSRSRPESMTAVSTAPNCPTSPRFMLTRLQASDVTEPSQTTALVDGDMSKRLKRRSLLPQFNRKVSADDKHELVIKEEYESSSSRPSTSSQHVEEDPDRRRGGIDEERRAMPPPTIPTRLSRPISMVPPRGASQHARTKTQPVAAPKEVEDEPDDVDAEDARAQSLAALTGASPATPSKPALTTSGLQRAGSTRLPQSPRVGGPVIPSRTTSNRTSQAPSRGTRTTMTHAHTTSLTEKRSSVTRTRTQSGTDQASEAKENASPPRSSVMSRGRPASHMPARPASPPRATTTARPRPTSQMLPPPKPTFNTYQQHYSPAKSALPKPPIPSAKVSKASSTEEHGDMTFDIAKQQIELLQLSLLHQASGKCMQEYTASARRKLGKHHTKLRKEYENIRATELEQQRLRNLSALESWCRDPSMLVENLQILSLVYSDLTALIEDGSRHGDVIQMFELWMDKAEALEPGVFIQPLPDDWKAAHSSLALKLRSIQRNLGVLPPPSEATDECSGLATVLRGCKTLVDGMMKELEVMVKLEKEVLARERTRLEEDVKALVLDDVGMQPVWRPAWQKA